MSIAGFSLNVSVVMAASLCATQAAQRQVTIVLPANPAPPQQFAGQELVKYLTAMGNSAPLLRKAPDEGDLYIGTFPEDITAADRRAMQQRLGSRYADTFTIRSVGKRLILTGNSPRADLYAAYEYLQSLGARWYFPGPENEVIPKAEVRLEGFDITQVPSFRKRGIVAFYNSPGLQDLIDFAAKAKLNTIGLHVYPTFPSFFDAGQAGAAKWVEPRGLNLDIERHFFGERFCPDDVKTLEEERSKLTRYLAELPSSMKEFFLWAADKRLPPCASPEYRDYSQSDLVLWFSNQMAHTIRRLRPGAEFAYLSYLSTWPAPEHVKPDPGVFLEWAPINQSFGQAIDDPESSVNAEFRKNFEAQLKVFGAENTQVLGYWLDDWLFYRSYFGKLPYHPKALKGDLSYYHRMGVRAITNLGIYTSRDYFLSHVSPIMFLYPDLLWNINTDPHSVVEDFCRHYFGSEKLAAIFDLLAEADRKVYVEGQRVKPERAADPDFVAAVSKALAIAQEHLGAQTTPEARARAARLVQEVSGRFSFRTTA